MKTEMTQERLMRFYFGKASGAERVQVEEALLTNSVLLEEYFFLKRSREESAPDFSLSSRSYAALRGLVFEGQAGRSRRGPASLSKKIWFASAVAAASVAIIWLFQVTESENQPELTRSGAPSSWSVDSASEHSQTQNFL